MLFRQGSAFVLCLQNGPRMTCRAAFLGLCVQKFSFWPNHSSVSVNPALSSSPFSRTCEEPCVYAWKLPKSQPRHGVIAALAHRKVDAAPDAAPRRRMTIPRTLGDFWEIHEQVAKP